MEQEIKLMLQSILETQEKAKSEIRAEIVGIKGDITRVKREMLGIEERLSKQIEDTRNHLSNRIDQVEIAIQESIQQVDRHERKFREIKDAI